MGRGASWRTGAWPWAHLVLREHVPNPGAIDHSRALARRGSTEVHGTDACVADSHEPNARQARLLEHERTVFVCLVSRCHEMCNAESDVLLYDLLYDVTSTCFEPNPPLERD